MQRVSISRSGLRRLAAAGLGACAIFSTWTSACAPPPPGAEGDALGLPRSTTGSGGDAAAAPLHSPSRAAGSGTGATANRLDEILPPEALELLAQSTRDSCAICAERNRERAFAILDESCVPGRLVIADGEARFLRVEGGEHEVSLDSPDRAEPTVTFRFHTAGNHHVGVAESAWTDETIAEIWESLPPETGGVGTLEIVAYAYGDGPAYLYFQGRNHLQVQCRILDLSE